MCGHHTGIVIGSASREVLLIVLHGWISTRRGLHGASRTIYSRCCNCCNTTSCWMSCRTRVVGARRGAVASSATVAGGLSVALDLRPPARSTTQGLSDRRTTRIAAQSSMTAALKLGLCARTRGEIHVASMTEAFAEFNASRFKKADNIRG
jgi:hypothetical protein